MPSKKTRLALCASVTALIAGGVLIAASFGARFDATEVKVVSAAPQPPAKSLLPASPTASVVAPATSATVPAKATASNEQELPAYEDNPLAEQEVVLRLAEVADQYAAAIKYPTFSEPITDATALQKYLPNQSYTNAMPLDPQDPHSPRMVLLTDKHRYFSGENIVASVRLDGADADARITVNGRLISEGRVLLQVPGVASADGDTFGLVYSLGAASAVSGGEMRVVAQIDLDGKTYELGTQIEYVKSMASITAVGSAQLQGEYLSIPVQVSTSNPGYHEVAANLYSASSGQPLIHLDTQEELQTVNGILTLRAHIRALKVKGDAGPYLLKDLLITRMPSAPDFVSTYGHSLQPAYPVNGFPLGSYNDEPYIDNEAQERLEFLRGLVSVP